MVTYQLERGIFTNEFNYYFSMLSDRFESLNDLWIEQLEKKFNKKFKPIYILPAEHNELFREENYIVLNEKQEDLQKNAKSKKIIYLIYPEDLNKQFCNSKFINDL